jgi:hypothetical protein
MNWLRRPIDVKRPCASRNSMAILSGRQCWVESAASAGACFPTVLPIWKGVLKSLRPDVYNMNPNGSLDPVAGSPFQTVTGYNAGLTLSPNNQFLFVTDPFGNNGASDISNALAANQPGQK